MSFVIKFMGCGANKQFTCSSNTHAGSAFLCVVCLFHDAAQVAHLRARVIEGKLCHRAPSPSTIGHSNYPRVFFQIEIHPSRAHWQQERSRHLFAACHIHIEYSFFLLRFPSGLSFACASFIQCIHKVHTAFNAIRNYSH